MKENSVKVGKAACPEYIQHHTVNFTKSQVNGAKKQHAWPSDAKSILLVSFYLGYLISQIPGGWISDKFGARYVLIGSVTITTIGTGVFPVMTNRWGWMTGVALRFFLGAAHGPCLPAISSLVNAWIPLNERHLWGSIAFSGSNLGNLLGNTISGVLIDTFWWDVAFYFWAAYSLLYLIFVVLLLYSYPEMHPFIMTKEVEYIQQMGAGEAAVKKKDLRTPWKKILMNRPYWANVLAQFGHNLIYIPLVTYLPTYMSDILQFDAEQNGLSSAMPFVCLWITSLILASTACYFLRCMSEKFFVTFFGAGCNVASSIFLLGAGYSGCNRYLAIALFNFCMIIKAFYYVTLPMNIANLSKHYGGIMFGISNTVGAISGIIGNVNIGILLKENQFHEWQTAFWITFGICVVTTIIFAIFGSTERQSFDYEESDERASTKATNTADDIK
ncbi:sialin-like isoform X2 [Anthonomus grandis grandis]|nr:sialin-like isoform X2 [Anthonomus grandis grandis]